MEKILIIGLISVIFLTGCPQNDSDIRNGSGNGNGATLTNTVIVTTDKTQYSLGEEVKVIVKNDTENSIFYNQCRGIKVAGKGWWEGCEEGLGTGTGADKTIVSPPCSLGPGGLDSPLAIKELSPRSTITFPILFDRAGKIPICVKGEFEYYSHCAGNECIGLNTAYSDFVEITQ